MINLEVGLQIQMLSGQELNILCIGQLTAGKSTFLQSYTHTQPTQQHYKIFVRRQKLLTKLPIVYLHEIEEKVGVDVYLNSSYDGILFFVKIDDFHNTRRNVVDSLALYSQVSGCNIYKIPIKIIVISSKRGQNYDDITYGEKRKLEDEVNSIFQNNQIVYVESNKKDYQTKLSQFYQQILNNQAQGIKQTLTSSWQTKTILNFLFPDQLKLPLLKIYQQLKYVLLQKYLSLQIMKKRRA